MMKNKIPGTETEASFSFICYEKADDKEYGPICAQRAINDLNGKEVEGKFLYVKEALKKRDRVREKMRELLKFKNSKKRCNLFIKNFPPETTEDELAVICSKYGPIESIKMFEKEGGIKFAFVCFSSPDAASLARQSLHQATVNGKQLYVNFYELKETRKIE